jgi:hypothetical protein
MPQVSVTINGRRFRMACENGEEPRLMRLAEDSRRRAMNRGLCRRPSGEDCNIRHPGEFNCVENATLRGNWRDAASPTQALAHSSGKLRRPRISAPGRPSGGD